jgi:DNA-binding response OmpR family regulator
MQKKIAILSISREIQSLLNDFYNENNLIIYRNIDSIKKDEFSILLVDCDVFKNQESIQFFLSKIRKKTQEKPVILLINRDYLIQFHTEWFFNDFTVSPYETDELIARINIQLSDKNHSDERIAIGNISIDVNEYRVYLEDQKVDLTYKEFELLRLFVENRGIVFSRKDLLNRIWGMEYIGGTRTVDVHIRRLRGKLGDEFNSIIETVRNVGYRCIE